MNKPKICLPGDVYGKWTVIKEGEPRIYTFRGKECKSRRVVCRCECGTEQEIEATSLRRGHSTQCKICRYNPNYMLGKRFGSLVVLKYVGKSNNGKYTYSCACDCGNKKDIVGASLLSGRTKTCGHKKFGQENHNWRGYQEIPSSYFWTLKNNAKKRNINFEITMEDVWNKYLEQKKQCALSGRNISFCQKYSNASVDRVDSDLGYTPENIQIVHLDIYLAKQSLSQDDFIKLCFDVANTQN